MKAASNKTEFDWKQLGDTAYLYSVRTGKILGRVEPFHTHAIDGSLYLANTEDRHLGDYVNEGYAKAAVLEAASLEVTKKTTKRV